MNGLSAMKRTASTSSSIFAVSSAITFLSGNSMPAVIAFGPSPGHSPRNTVVSWVELLRDPTSFEPVLGRAKELDPTYIDRTKRFLCGNPVRRRWAFAHHVGRRCEWLMCHVLIPPPMYAGHPAQSILPARGSRLPHYSL